MIASLSSLSSSLLSGDDDDATSASPVGSSDVVVSFGVDGVGEGEGGGATYHLPRRIRVRLSASSLGSEDGVINAIDTDDDDDSRGDRGVLLVVVSIDSSDCPILRSEARRGESDSDPSGEVVRRPPPSPYPSPTPSSQKPTATP